MANMQVIVRLQDRGALRLDHLHDQALCEPDGRGDLSITHIVAIHYPSLRTRYWSRSREAILWAEPENII